MSPRGTLLAASAVLALAASAPAPALADYERKTKALHAEKELLGLHFFADGGGMHLPPNILKVPNALAHGPRWLPNQQFLKWSYTRLWGLNWDAKRKRPVGLFNVPYKKKMKVGVLGCVACHSGKAAGRFYVGLGAKNVDVYQIGRNATMAIAAWRALTGPLTKEDDDVEEVTRTARRFAKTLADPSYTNLTQGLVPTAIIRTWFYRVAGRPLPREMPRAAVKVPALWGYGEKRKVGQFSDGFGNGHHAGWGIAVELAAGQKPETVRGYLPKIERAEDLLGDLLPPRYPYPIVAERAERGKKVYESTCSHCHGTYELDSESLPVYKAPEYFDWSVVRTDPDRLMGRDEEFLRLVRESPLNDVIQYNPDKGNGYFAPRLVGIWARFPYLHNGSVPSIAALLTPPDLRPKAFSLKDAGEEYRFDTLRLGLTMPAPGSKAERKLLRQGRPKSQGGKERRDVYYTGRDGQSNQGHPFGTELDPEDKEALIEYLKTL